MYLKKINNINLKDRTKQLYHYLISTYILPYFEDMQIESLDNNVLQQYLIHLASKDLSTNTIKLVWRLLKAVIKENKVDIDFEDIIIPQTHEKQVDAFTKVEQKQIEDKLNISRSPKHIGILLALYLGLRLGETLALKWEDIDFTNKLITIKRSVYIKDNKLTYSTPKTKSSIRTIPLPQAEELLLKKKESIEKNKTMLGKSYNDKYLDYVCVDNIGRLILPNRLTKNFIKILRKNNLRKIRFHDLRHSCASIMLANGVPMKQIQEWLGHADFGTTANIYSHLDYTIKQNSANTISNVFSFVETNQPKQEIKQEQDKETHQQELLDEIERLKQMIKEKEEDEEYLAWQREREEKRKKKQSDMEM